MSAMTLIVMGIVTLVLIGYDVYVFIAKAKNYTISYNLYAVCKAYPILAFLLGGIFAHILWLNCSACIP